MNSHNPFNTGGSGCVNDFRSADQLVDRIIGDAYHVVKEVYLALGNLTYIYNYLQKYGLIITVDSEDAIKDIPLSIGKFARVYNKSESAGYYFTDYLYVADDTTGIPSNDPTATGSWVSTKATGSNASFVRIWKYHAVTDGETVIQLPTDMPIIGVQTIYVQGSRQDVGEGFTYNEGDATITLADELEAGNLVTVIIGVTDPDMDIDIFEVLKGNNGASGIGTLSGNTVQEVLDQLALEITTSVGALTTKLASNVGASNVGTSSGDTVENALLTLGRKLSTVMPEDFSHLYSEPVDQIKAAMLYAKTNGITSVTLVPGKTYKITGTSGLEVDLGYYSFGCPFGSAYLDFTEFTGIDCLWVHSSQPYPIGARNHLHKLRGVRTKGSIQNIDQSLLVIGNNNDNSNGTYNGDCKIEDCLFSTADIVLKATNSTWRYKFINCGFMMETAGKYAMLFPAGLTDSGESITLQNCKIFDMKRCPILVACANFSMAMPGTSVLNTPIQVTGAGSLLILDSASNIENPVAPTWYRFVEVTGVGARVVLDGATLVCNGPANQTKPLFYVGTNAFMVFHNVKLPGNAYRFYMGDEGYDSFVEGPGYVIATSNIADITSGAGNKLLHRSLTPIRNYAFAAGDLTGWSFNTQGSVSQTAVVAPEYGNTGYGVRITSYGSLSCYLTQKPKVINNNYFTTSMKARVQVAGTGTSAGSLTITFYDRDGVVLQSGGTATIPNTVGDWVSYGAFLHGRVPQNAEYAEVSIRCREGAVIDVDSILINYI